jgi:hypothetical protein
MNKRVIGAIIGIIGGIIIYEIVHSNLGGGQFYAERDAGPLSICLLVGGLLCAYIADGFKSKS